MSVVYDASICCVDNHGLDVQLGGYAGNVCFDGLVRHDVLQEHVYWYWVKGFLNGGKDVDCVLEQVAR